MFGRRKPTPQAEAIEVAPKPEGKGRPTPRRAEAERHRRQRVAPPKNRREAARRARERMRQQRSETRRAVMTGDERHLPPRDAGPVRRFARDYVDSRRTLSEYLIIVVFALLLLSFIQIPVLNAFLSLLMLLLFFAVVIEMMLIARGVRREVGKRWPGEEGQKGLGFYAAMRATQTRRLRLPKPKVARGAKL